MRMKTLCRICSRCAWPLLALLALMPLGMGAEETAATTVTATATPTETAAKAKPDTDADAAVTGPKLKPVPRPPAAELERTITRGVDFLIRRQNANGSWGSSSSARLDDIYAPVPGSFHAFRAAVTAMCISALLEAGGDRPDVARAVDRAETWLLEHLPAVRRAAPDTTYNNWTHAYGLQALAKLLKRHAGDKERCAKIRQVMAQQVDMLRRYECVDGGWAYYDLNAHTQLPSGSTMGFLTAAVLVALRDTRDAGVDVPQRLIDRAKASILRQRKPDFSVIYGEYLKSRPMLLISRPQGSMGRSQACNVAMRLWGDKTVTDHVLRTWLDWLFARNLWLDLGRKTLLPHQSWCQVAGYFYYFGHYYAALCIDQLPEAERPPYRDQLAQVLMHVQDKDGSWWDFPLYDYHQQYGTAFALMALSRCRQR
jgi:hypothetical protein